MSMGKGRDKEDDLQRLKIDAALLDGVRCRLERGRSPSHDLIEAHQRGGRAALVEAVQLK